MIRRVRFWMLVVLWLFALDYLVLTKSVADNRVLNVISLPFSNLITGRVAGGVTSSNPLVILIVVNITIALLFYMSYVNWEAKHIRTR